ncbi:MAG: hypothetical protein ABMA13_18240 [Chthoniobacteraceae bacterium]
MKAYLGDAVYAESAMNGVVLTTSNGVEVSNTIVLEPEVIAALFRFVESLKTAPRICPRCGETNAPASLKCDECGLDLTVEDSR